MRFMRLCAKARGRKYITFTIQVLVLPEYSRKHPCIHAAKAVAANSSQLAMGRVVGSLSVLTARDEDATAAMLASWVSQVRTEIFFWHLTSLHRRNVYNAGAVHLAPQASFNPPGVTVAVKKDRAMEPLLVVGGKFALSMLAEVSREFPESFLLSPSPGL